MSLMAFIIIGVVSGWLAGVLVKGGGFGLLGDLILGVVGAYIGSHLIAVLGVHVGRGMVGQIIVATLGAATLLFLARLIRPQI